MCRICGKPVAAHGLCKNHYGQRLHKAQRRAAKLNDAKLCAFCEKPISVKSRKRGEVAYCTPRCKQKAYTADGRTAEVALRSYYKTRYGLTPEQADEMRKAGCAICGTSEWGGRWGNAHIDHDHETGQVRGVLCTNCNIGIGKFKDDVVLLRRAADYLS